MAQGLDLLRMKATFDEHIGTLAALLLDRELDSQLP